MEFDRMMCQLHGSVLLASFGHYFYGITLSVVAVMLILLVLIQRGRGGGLAGAFGGMGGQSAFGTKAGDTFTRITIGLAVVWLILSVSAVKFLGYSSGAFGDATPLTETQLEPLPGGDQPLLPPAGGTTSATGEGSGAAAPAETPAADANSTDGAPAAEVGSGDFPAPGAEPNAETAAPAAQSP